MATRPSQHTPIGLGYNGRSDLDQVRLFAPWPSWTLAIHYVRVVGQPVKPGAHELPRQRCRSVAAGGARQKRPGPTCAHTFRAHLAARSRETNICRVEYFSAGASKGAPRLPRVRGSAGVL